MDNINIIWREILDDTCNKNNIHLSPLMKQYLVLTISHYQTQADIGEQTLGYDLLKAVHLPPVERSLLLKKTGDNCLLMAGFFPEKHEKLMVPKSYFVQVGKTAYRSISENKTQIGTDENIYQELDHHFLTLVYTLTNMRKPY